MEGTPVPAPRSHRNGGPSASLPPPDDQSLGLNQSESQFLTQDDVRVSEFHRLYREAYSSTLEAQNLDADGLREQAFKCYTKALEFIDELITLAHRGGFSSPEVNRIDELTLKVRMARKEILERVSDLQGSNSTASEDYLQGPAAAGASAPREDLPPPYSEIALPGQALPGTSSRSVSYSTLAAVLDEISSEQATLANPLPINAHEIFSVPENVQIYFISSNDNVSAPSYPSFLRLVVMEQQGGELAAVTASVPAFLQVGDWTYPLIPNHSPVFRSSEGIYMFPDLISTAPGSYVGLLLPDGILPEQRKAFEEALLQLLGFQKFPEPTKPESPKVKREAPEIPPRPQLPPGAALSYTTERRLSTKIAEGLITGAEAVSRGLIFGATKTSGFIDKGAAFLQSKLEPAKDKTNIKPEYKKGMKTAKSVTGKAVQVSGYVVTQVGHATLALGRHLAPHVHKASTKLLARTVATDETDASYKVDQVFEVTSGAVYGFGTVYMGLENAAKVLATSISSNTVQIVQHRYGDEAGEFATDTAATAGNAALTAWNARSLAPKAMAKRVAKDTGKIMLDKHHEKRGPVGSPPDGPPPGGSGMV